LVQVEERETHKRKAFPVSVFLISEQKNFTFDGGNAWQQLQ